MATMPIKQWVGDKGKIKHGGNDPFDVQTVQKLLKAAAAKLSKAELDPGSSNGHITPATITAIRALQTGVMGAKTADGRIDAGGRTWKALLQAAGEVDTNPDSWPAKPEFLPLSLVQVMQKFGDFEFEDAPDKDNGDGINILGDWKKKNIVTVEIPQLAKIAKPGAKRKEFHRRCSRQLQGVWQAWDDAGLLDRVKTFDGAFVTRYKRKMAHVGKASLSNHAWGTAFDINYQWNKLGATPAIIWEGGCVFELVLIANTFGFFWGGHFGAGRIDGMHFEVALPQG